MGTELATVRQVKTRPPSGLTARSEYAKLDKPLTETEIKDWVNE